MSSAPRVGRNNPASPHGCARSTRIHPRPRRPSGVGRAPAWTPPALRRRPPGAARCGPRRRRWGFVMRRRPIAVYRVIDEEELLGGGSSETREGPVLPDDLERAISGRVRRRRRRPRLHGGWGATAASVAGLSAIAVLLLSTTAHAPAAPRPLRFEPVSRQRRSNVSRPPVLTTTPAHRRGKPRRSRPAPRQVRRPVLHRRDASRSPSSQPTRVQAAAPPAASAVGSTSVAAPDSAPSTIDPSTGPSAEFGFER